MTYDRRLVLFQSLRQLRLPFFDVIAFFIIDPNAKTDDVNTGPVVNGFGETIQGLLIIPHVIAVNENQILTSGDPNPRISSFGTPGILLMNSYDAAVFPRERITQCAAIIPRTIIHQDQFKVFEGLASHAADAALQFLLCVVDRHDNAEHRTAHNDSFPSACFRRQ